MRAAEPDWRADAAGWPLDRALATYVQHGYRVVGRDQHGVSLARRRPVSVAWAIAWLILALLGWLVSPFVSVVAAVALAVWIIRALARSDEAAYLQAEPKPPRDMV